MRKKFLVSDPFFSKVVMYLCQYIMSELFCKYDLPSSTIILDR